jgi:hypothetical protein
VGGAGFDTTRVRLGDLIAAVSGVVLFISLFLTWYERSSEGALGGGFPSLSYSGWESLGLIENLLLLAALAAVALAVLKAFGLQPQLPVSPGLVVLVLGAVAVLLVLYRLLDTPSGLFEDVPGIDVERSVGPFVALAAALGVTLGGWMAWNDEGRTAAGPTARRRTEPIPPA